MAEEINHAVVIIMELINIIWLCYMAAFFVKLIPNLNAVRVKKECVNSSELCVTPLIDYCQSRRQQVRLYRLSADSAGKPATLEMRSTAIRRSQRTTRMALPFGDDLCAQGEALEEKYA
jgi:hypothetical protein